ADASIIATVDPVANPTYQVCAATNSSGDTIVEQGKPVARFTIFWSRPTVPAQVPDLHLTNPIYFTTYYVYNNATDKLDPSSQALRKDVIDPGNFPFSDGSFPSGVTPCPAPPGTSYNYSYSFDSSDVSVALCPPFQFAVTAAQDNGLES